MLERMTKEKYMKNFVTHIAATAVFFIGMHSFSFAADIIPSDDKKTARLLVAKQILETLQSYSDVKYPKLELKKEESIVQFKNDLLNS